MSSPADRARSKSVELDREWLARRLRELPAPDGYCVAFSGGLDSTVLLSALADLRGDLPAPLRAVHVDHGLHPASGDWAIHCEAVCRSLDIPLTRCSVDARPARGESPEAAARHARYAAIGRLIGDRGLLLTAHHRDDQAETLLLQLMRAAGVAGLAAMPTLKAFGRGWHARPLLDLPRSALRQWAEGRALQWIDDPSNRETDADRNYLRHEVIPALVARWPAAAASIARTAGHAAAAHDALREQADEDLQRIRVDAQRVAIEGLRGLSFFRQRAVMRRWFETCDLPAPSSDRLAEMVDQMLHAGEDSALCFELGGFQLRRFRAQAWLVEPPRSRPPVTPIAWPDSVDEVALPHGVVRRVRRGRGITPEAWRQGRVEVRFRTPGFRCLPTGRLGHRGFKALAQEAGIPPWSRPWLPLLFIDDRPAAVANCCVCEPFGHEGDGWWVEWSQSAEARAGSIGGSVFSTSDDS